MTPPVAGAHGPHREPGSARTAPARWLDERLGGIPVDLARVVRVVAGDAADGDAFDPRALAEASLEGLERVAADVGQRDRALALLAADALLTYAFEAAADPAAGGSAAAAAALAAEVGPAGALGRRSARGSLR